MKHKTKLLLAVAVLSALIPVGVASAKEIVQVTVSGPGLDNVRFVTDQRTFDSLIEITDWSQIVSQPPEVGESFFEVRLGFGERGQEPFAWNVYHYFPDPVGETSGYVYFEDVVGGSSSEEGRWFRASRAGAEALAALVSNPDLSIALSAVPALPASQTSQAALRPVDSTGDLTARPSAISTAPEPPELDQLGLRVAVLVALGLAVGAAGILQRQSLLARAAAATSRPD